MSTSDTIATSMREKADDAKTARTRMALADLEERLAVVRSLQYLILQPQSMPAPAGLAPLLGRVADRLTEARRQLQEESVG